MALWRCVRLVQWAVNAVRMFRGFPADVVDYIVRVQCDAMSGYAQSAWAAIAYGKLHYCDLGMVCLSAC